MVPQEAAPREPQPEVRVAAPVQRDVAPVRERTPAQERVVREEPRDLDPAACGGEAPVRGDSHDVPRSTPRDAGQDDPTDDPVVQRALELLDANIVRVERKSV